MFYVRFVKLLVQAELNPLDREINHTEYEFNDSELDAFSYCLGSLIRKFKSQESQHKSPHLDLLIIDDKHNKDDNKCRWVDTRNHSNGFVRNKL